MRPSETVAATTAAPAVAKKSRRFIGSLFSGVARTGCTSWLAPVAGHLTIYRLAIWALFVLQLLSLVIGAIAKTVSTPAHPLHLDAGCSTNGWLAVLLTFLLARVFAEGALLREDLEGTV